MEKEISKIVSENLTKLRKAKGLTQMELANTFNFSDKTISKWESGESLPNIDILGKLCEFYGITFNDLTNSSFEAVDENIKKKKEAVLTTNKVIISLLAITLVWIIATITYIYMDLYANVSFWLAFIWAVPVSFVIAIIFNAVFGTRKITFWLLSGLIWTFLAAFYLQTLAYNIWTVFILGIPSQIAIILWSGLKKN